MSERSVDPETLAYTRVDPTMLDRLADSYRRGIEQRLAERHIDTDEELPRLVVAGYAVEPEPWTMLRTSQDTAWHVGVLITDEDRLLEAAYQFGRAEGDDHWQPYR